MIIDLNCDMGESYGRFKIGNDAALMPFLSSCNIACGFHAGDPLHIDTTIRAALEHGLRIGAHPSYPDLAGFGRRPMLIPRVELEALVKYQIAAVKGLVEAQGGRLSYVKPHGALYNSMVQNCLEAEAVISAIQAIDADLTLMGLANSPLVTWAKEMGIAFISEGFADRRYEANGQLRSRNLEGAVLESPELVVDQVLSMVLQGKVLTIDGQEVDLEVDSVCMHGDNPAAGAILMALHRSFKTHNISLS